MNIEDNVLIIILRWMFKLIWTILIMNKQKNIIYK